MLEPTRAAIAVLAFFVLMVSAAEGQPLNLSDTAKADIAKTIRAHGFNCPVVVSAGARGEDPYGKVFRVRCGPASRSGTWDQFPQFKVTVRPSGGAIVAPWD